MNSIAPLQPASDLSLKAVRTSRVWEKRVFRFPQRSISHESRYFFFICLHQLLSAEVPLLSALESLYTMGKKPLKKALQACIQQVAQGASLSHALASTNLICDSISYTLIQSGEKTAMLPSALKAVVGYLKKTHAFKQKMYRALSYPLLTLGVMLMAVGVLLKILLPQLTDCMTILGGEMPGSSRALLWCYEHAAFIQLALVSVFAVCIAGYALARMNQGVRKRCHQLALFTPLVSELWLSWHWGRFFYVWQILDEEKLFLVDAWTVATKAMDILPIQEQLHRSTARLCAGEKPSMLLSTMPGISPMVAQLLRTGEDSTTLVPSLEHIGSFYEQRFTKLQEALATYLPPFFLFVLGGVLVWVLSGTFLPLYENLTRVVL